MSMKNIDIVWERIKRYQGERFYLLGGEEMTYSINEEQLTHNRTNWPIYRRSFEQALIHVPLESPSSVGKIIRGGSYLFAILMDERIRQSDW